VEAKTQKAKAEKYKVEAKLLSAVAKPERAEAVLLRNKVG